MVLMNDYEKKIYKALQYIQDNLQSEFNWVDVSKFCGISEFHFHRIFSGYMGETPGDFIKRKRLEKAVLYLAYGCENSISEIAYICGYSSQANLSKAFKIYFGVTPGDVIKGVVPKNSKIGKIKSKYGKDFNVVSLYPDPDLIKESQQHYQETLMNVVMRDLEERKVIYLRSKDGYLKESIHSTWDQLVEKAMHLPIQKDSFEMYGIGHDNPQVTPEDKCRYDACIALEDGVKIGNDLNTKSLPKGKYACFYYKGSTEKILQLYLEIYSNWFPKSGYEPGDHPLIEKYINVSKTSDDIEMEVQFLVK
jgi:AraC family transcriptional regulator